MPMAFGRGGEAPIYAGHHITSTRSIISAIGTDLLCHLCASDVRFGELTKHQEMTDLRRKADVASLKLDYIATVGGRPDKLG